MSLHPCRRDKRASDPTRCDGGQFFSVCAAESLLFHRLRSVGALHAHAIRLLLRTDRSIYSRRRRRRRRRRRQEVNGRFEKIDAAAAEFARRTKKSAATKTASPSLRKVVGVPRRVRLRRQLHSRGDLHSFASCHRCNARRTKQLTSPDGQGRNRQRQRMAPPPERMLRRRATVRLGSRRTTLAELSCKRRQQRSRRDKDEHEKRRRRRRRRGRGRRPRRQRRRRLPGIGACPVTGGNCSIMSMVNTPNSSR